MAVRPNSLAQSFIIRLCISNDAGYILNMNIYKEVADPQTGVLKFFSFAFDQVESQILFHVTVFLQSTGFFPNILFLDCCEYLLRSYAPTLADHKVC